MDSEHQKKSDAEAHPAQNIVVSTMRILRGVFRKNARRHNTDHVHENGRRKYTEHYRKSDSVALFEEIHVNKREKAKCYERPEATTSFCHGQPLMRQLQDVAFAKNTVAQQLKRQFRQSA